VVLQREGEWPALALAHEVGAVLAALPTRAGPALDDPMLRESPVPLLLTGRSARAPAPLRRLLVPLDPAHPDAGADALPLVALLARRQDAVVLLLAVVEPGADASPAELLSRRAGAEAVLDDAHRRLLSGAAALTRVASGPVDLSILQAAADADLLVVGGGGGGGRGDDGAARGEVVERVLERCPCPVLWVPATAARGGGVPARTAEAAG
jgi:nucleotide-binding universal stress UspA family protein